jgi:hypothetical protein
MMILLLHIPRALASFVPIKAYNNWGSEVRVRYSDGLVIDKHMLVKQKRISAIF